MTRTIIERIKNISIWFLALLLLGACSLRPATGRGQLTPYKYWKKYFYKHVFYKEIRELCKNWPPEWNKCPNGKFQKKLFDLIDVDSDIIELKNAIADIQGKGEVVDSIAVAKHIQFGFNAWYVEGFFLKVGDKWKYLEIYRVSIDYAPKSFKAETPARRYGERDDLLFFHQSKSGVLSSNCNMLAITYLDKELRILSCHAAICY